MDTIAITDHGSMFGVVEFYKQAIKRNKAYTRLRSLCGHK